MSTTDTDEDASAAGESQSALETFCAGDPFEYAMVGIDQIPGPTKHKFKHLSDAIEQEYGTDLSDDTGSILDQLNSANSPKGLIDAVENAGLDDVDDWSDRIREDDLNSSVDDVDDPGLGEAMRLIDTKLSSGGCPRSKDASAVTSKKNREHAYVPDIVNSAEGGTVYMAKTISSPDKVRMAWDLNDSNQVVVVDDYEKWEKLLGWEKLKQFPHGKNKIREELGDALSDEVLEIVAGDEPDDTDDSSSGNSSSRGRRTRTKPSDEILNLARGSRHRKRNKKKAEEIADIFDDGDTIGYYNIETVVLFPSTTDLNMTDHWWVAGARWSGGGNVAIANCNKGTFEYLNQYEQVWHIEDYLDQASEYEFPTSEGPLTLDSASTHNLVFHIMSEESRRRFMRDEIVEDIPTALVEYVDEEMYSRRAPELPHPDDMVYAPITEEDAFWMRPALRKQQNPEDGDAVVCYGDASSRNLGNTYSISSDYRLYSRARLSDWDFDAVELTKLDRADHYFGLNDGGYEMLEMLGELHDAGKQPFSQTPKARWSQ